MGVFTAAIAIAVLLGATLSPATAHAATLSLSWTDHAGGTVSFEVHRKTGAGSYAQIATTGIGATSYVDSTVAASTSYCYKVNATGVGGDSPFSNEACATSAAAPGLSVTVAKSGTGSGSVASSPAGISCGSDCSETYSAATTVTLTASAAAGSTFTGGSGGGGSGTGPCGLGGSAAVSVTATFAAATTPPPTAYGVTVAKAGTGAGTVVSTPSGIACGTTCLFNFTSGTTVVLNPQPSTGSVFAGWSGDADCADGRLLLPGARRCTATFNVTSATSAPILTGIWPSSIQHGAATFTLLVFGSKFVPGATVRWNGSARPTVFRGANMLTVAISVKDIVAAGTAAITVANPAPSGASGPVSFTIR